MKTIFQILGIDSLNIQSLKEVFIQEVNKATMDIVNTIKIKIKELELNKKIEIALATSSLKSKLEIEEIESEWNEKIALKELEIDSEISQREDEIDQYIYDVTNSNDAAIILYHLKSMRLHNLRKISTLKKSDSKGFVQGKKEANEIYDKIDNVFSSPEEIKQYIQKVFNILNYVDVKNCNMNMYRHVPSVNIDDNNSKKQHLLYDIEIKKPIKLFDETISKSGYNDITVYKFGTFTFLKNVIQDNGEPELIRECSLIGIIRKNEFGDQVIQHCAVYINPKIKEKFYLDIVFSDILIDNANRNNFGYIGGIKKVPLLDRNGEIIPNKYRNQICFDRESDRCFVEALSFAMEEPGQINLKSMHNLRDVYNYIDEELMHRIRIPDSHGDEGGR